MNSEKIAITMGDPNGIGPEIIIKTLCCGDFDLNKIMLFGNKEVFKKTAVDLGLKLPDVDLIEINFDLKNFSYGVESKHSGQASFQALQKACEYAKSKKINAIATAPLSKKAINLAGFEFSGQTEILEKFLSERKTQKAEMLFVSNNFRVMILTRHCPLKDVPSLISKENIKNSVLVLHKALKDQYKIENPTIAICGLNPHAGENGLLGLEEQNIIIPAISELQKNYNINIKGPFPADTLFAKASNHYHKGEKMPYDCYLACYHDQGLTPIKVVAMNKTVNTTIGLPVFRTSPAHGTAFDIAGKGMSDYSSMKEAVKLAIDLC